MRRPDRRVLTLQAHDPKVVGSSPTPATIESKQAALQGRFALWRLKLPRPRPGVLFQDSTIPVLPFRVGIDGRAPAVVHAPGYDPKLVKPARLFTV